MIVTGQNFADNDGQKGALLAPLVVSTEVAVNPLSAAPQFTSVYRYYDRSDILIYVGITSGGILRQRQHNYSKEWWPLVVRQEVDHYPTRDEAHAHEIDLIRVFKPPFNKQHNTEHEVMRAAYTAFKDSELLTPSKDIGGIVQARRKGIDLFCSYEPATYRIKFRTRLEDAPLARYLRHKPTVHVTNAHGYMVGHVISLQPQGPSASGEIRLKPFDPKARVIRAIALLKVEQVKPQKIVVFKRVLLTINPMMPLTGKWDL